MKAVLPLVLMLGIAGCGRETATSAAAGGNSRAAEAGAVDESVVAISQTPGKPAITLRFEIGGKPRVGVSGPVRLDLAGDPGPVTIRVQGEGLVSDPAAAALTLSEAGVAATQTLQVTPQVAGIIEMVVRIQPQGDGAQEIVYAVPLLVEPAEPK